MMRRVIAVLVSVFLVFEQAGFAQVVPQSPIPLYLQGLLSPESFRPVHLRSLSIDPATKDITLTLDKGNSKDAQVGQSTEKLVEYFKIGLTLPNSTFWVNLRPDSASSMIDPYLERTDLGKALLEADLQLKKDLAALTAPNTVEGSQYWSKLYEKAETLFAGSQGAEIPAFTRPWIVPGEIILGRSANGVYIYKATLQVMLEQDYLKDAAVKISDPRLQELNEYASSLIRSSIIPRLTRQVNSSKKYAELRQAYYSLILAQWCKKNNTTILNTRIDSKDLSGLTSAAAWSKDTYFNAYRSSFANGEYNKEETLRNSRGQMVVRRYFLGGFQAGNLKFTVLPMRTDMPKADFEVTVNLNKDGGRLTSRELYEQLNTENDEKELEMIKEDALLRYKADMAKESVENIPVPTKENKKDFEEGKKKGLEKYNEDGTAKDYPGITTVGSVAAGSELYKFFADIQGRLDAAINGPSLNRITGKFKIAMVPVGSVHMTFWDLISQGSFKNDKIPSDLKDDIKLEIADLAKQNGISNENAAYQIVGERVREVLRDFQGSKQPEFKPSGIVSFNPQKPFGLLLGMEPATADDLAVVIKMQKAITDATGIKNFDDYKAHMTIGYIVGDMTEPIRKEILKVEDYIKATNLDSKKYKFTGIELSRFKNMDDFPANRGTYKWDQNGKQLLGNYLDQVDEKKVKKIKNLDKVLNLVMTPAQKKAYMDAIKQVLKEKGKDTITPDILRIAAERATEKDKSTVKARIGLQPGTMNPLHYGHMTAALAAILGSDLSAVILANGGTVPDKPYAASAIVRNEMANIAVNSDVSPQFKDYVQVTSARADVVDMFNENEALSIAGKDEKERRFNMDMAAFIWLFKANPNVDWLYLVGSDKVREYGQKNEVKLLKDTLKETNVNVVYFTRDGEEVDPKVHIEPYTWLKELWDDELFSESDKKSFAGLAAKKVRKELINLANVPEDKRAAEIAKVEIEGVKLVDSIAPEVINYIVNSKELPALYQMEFNEKDAQAAIKNASNLVKQGKTDEALAEYKISLDKYIDSLKLINEKKPFDSRVAPSEKELFTYLDNRVNEWVAALEFTKKFLGDGLDPVDIEFMSIPVMANVLRSLPLDRYGIEQKMLFYSGAPGSGKGAIDERITPYKDLFGKLLLYHTRQPRISDDKHEYDGLNYHFGYIYDGETDAEGKPTGAKTERLSDLKSEGRIIVAFVNKQEQGAARKEFFEQMELKKNSDQPQNRLFKGDIIVSITGKPEKLSVDEKDIDTFYSRIETVEKDRDVVDDVIVLRKISGIEESFGTEKITKLEGGYAWFKELVNEYPDIYTVFVSPFSAEQLSRRANNQMIIDQEFSKPFERFIAYSKMNMIRNEEGEEELDLNDAYLLERLKEDVKGWLKGYKTRSLPKEFGMKAIGRRGEDSFKALEQNAGLIESSTFIKELNRLLDEFFGVDLTIDNSNYLLAKSLAYEIQMKLARDVGRGDTSPYLDVPTPGEEIVANFTRPQDMFNRVIEGVSQIMLMDEYNRDNRGTVVLNPFVYDSSRVEQQLDKVAEEFIGSYFRYLIDAIQREEKTDNSTKDGGNKTIEAKVGEICLAAFLAEKGAKDIAESGGRSIYERDYGTDMAYADELDKVSATIVPALVALGPEAVPAIKDRIETENKQYGRDAFLISMLQKAVGQIETADTGTKVNDPAADLKTTPGKEKESAEKDNEPVKHVDIGAIVNDAAADLRGSPGEAKEYAERDGRSIWEGDYGTDMGYHNKIDEIRQQTINTLVDLGPEAIPFIQKEAAVPDNQEKLLLRKDSVSDALNAAIKIIEARANAKKDGGEQTEVGGIDMRGLPVDQEPVLTKATIPVPAELLKAAPAAVSKEWEQVKKTIATDSVAFKQLRNVAAACAQRKDCQACRAEINCYVRSLLRMEEEAAVPTSGELKEVLACL